MTLFPTQKKIFYIFFVFILLLIPKQAKADTQNLTYITRLIDTGGVETYNGDAYVGYDWARYNFYYSFGNFPNCSYINHITVYPNIIESPSPSTPYGFQVYSPDNSPNNLSQLESGTVIHNANVNVNNYPQQIDQADAQELCNNGGLIIFGRNQSTAGQFVRNNFLTFTVDYTPVAPTSTPTPTPVPPPTIIPTPSNIPSSINSIQNFATASMDGLKNNAIPIGVGITVTSAAVFAVIKWFRAIAHV